MDTEVVIVKQICNGYWFDFRGFRVIIKFNNNKFKATVFSKKFKPWEFSDTNLKVVIDTCINSIKEYQN